MRRLELIVAARPTDDGAPAPRLAELGFILKNSAPPLQSSTPRRAPRRARRAHAREPPLAAPARGRARRRGAYRRARSARSHAGTSSSIRAPALLLDRLRVHPRQPLDASPRRPRRRGVHRHARLRRPTPPPRGAGSSALSRTRSLGRAPHGAGLRSGRPAAPLCTRRVPCSIRAGDVTALEDSAHIELLLASRRRRTPRRRADAARATA